VTIYLLRVRNASDNAGMADRHWYSRLRSDEGVKHVGSSGLNWPGFRAISALREIMNMSQSSFGYAVIPAIAVALCAGPFASVAQAQDEKVYAMSDVQAPPKLSSTAVAARIIQDSYPAELKSRGVGGMVELQFIVDAKGKVDPASVEVVDATQTALGEAAKKVVTKLGFNPAKVNGTPVRVKVTLPIIYKP